ncbi:MAG: MFS transporter [Legionella sp.]|nr:MFS transporter [Legionella sp.]
MAYTTSEVAHVQAPTQQGQKAYRAVCIISLCAAFLFYKYVLQNFPSVMAQQLMAAFNLQGLGLGMFSGVYFWTYLIVPLFVGIILDRLGARYITATAILCCALGTFLCATTTSLNVAVSGRALIGVGVSFATIAYFKLAAEWFSQRYFALLTSFLVTSAMLGAVFGQMPLAWLVGEFGWRYTLTILAWVGVILALFFVIFVKDKPVSPQEQNEELPPRKIVSDLALVIKNKQNWLLTAYSGLAFSPVVIFCGLWGNPFLQKAYNLDKLVAPSLISLVFIGLAISSPLFALFTHRIKNRINFIYYWTLASALCISLVLYAQWMPIWLVSVALFFFGFCLGAFPLVFVIGKEINPLYLAGTTTSLLNASDALIDAIAEPAIGKALDFLHTTPAADFSLSSYHLALAALPVMQLVGALLIKRVHAS